MGNPVQKIAQFFSSTRYSRILGVLALLVIIAAVPLTVFIAQTQKQEVRQRAADAEGATNYKFWCDTNPCGNSVVLTWDNPTRQTYWNIVKLYNNTTGGVRHTKWTRGNSIRFTDLTPNQTYGYSVTSYFVDFTECDLASTYLGPAGNTDGNCTGDAKIHGVTFYSTESNHGPQTGNLDVGVPNFQSTVPPLASEGPSNFRNACNNNPCTSVTLTWDNPSRQTYWSIVKLTNTATGVRHTKWTKSNSIQFTDVTANQKYNYAVTSYFEDLTSCDISTAYLVLPSGTNNDGDCNTNPPEPTKKQQSVAYYYGAVHGGQTGSNDFQTAATPVSCSISATGNNITYGGSGANRVRLWLEKTDFSQVANSSTAISPFMREYPYSAPDTGKYSYQLAQCDGSTATCGSTVALTVPAGSYKLHCDVLSDANPNANKCSGTPGTLPPGWGRCATDGTDQIAYTNSPPPATATVTQPPATATVTQPPTGDGQQLAFKLTFPGIGTRAQGAGNLNNPTPRHPQRSITVQVYSADGTTLVQSKTVATGLAYQASTQTFDGTVTLNSALSAGNYVVKVKSNGYLYRRIPTVLVITSGNNTYNMYQGTTYPILIPGDINNDNIVNLLDYNLFVECYRATATCNADNKTLSDLNDDSLVNSEDLLILTRSFEIRNGD